MKKLSFSIIAFALCLLIALPGCSSMKKKGDGDGSGSLSETDLNAIRDKRFAGGSLPAAEGEGFFRDVHFDYDSARITDQAQQEIDYNVEVLKSNSDVNLQIEGHCDERGTAEYNLALGSQRAKTVKEALVAAGISSSRLSTISYGSEVPLDPGHDESAWAKNRRAHFSAFRGSEDTGSSRGSSEEGGRRY